MSDRLQEIRGRLDLAGTWSADGQDNAHFVEHAPADIAWLLDEVERLRGWARAWRVMAWRADHAWRASDGYDTRAGYPPEAEAHDELKRSRRKEWSERNREELAARADEWRRKHFEWIRDQQQRQRAMNEGGADA